MIVTRFAPSPTGHIHIGNVRTALFNYALARQGGGQFILRLDDTDAQRSTVQYADEIQRDLEWLGLTWDRLEKQSQRLQRYQAAAAKLRALQRFYLCFETPIELSLKRKKQLNIGNPPVYDRTALRLSAAMRKDLQMRRKGYWRFLLEQSRVSWNDGILGAVSVDAASVSDPVLIRGDGQILYTLASVCDDIDHGITHVVRGSDHVTNTAVQIQIIQALGKHVPEFYHHSLLTSGKGKALSKRLKSLTIKSLRERGVEPLVILSHLTRLGSAEPIRLCASIDEVVATFDLNRFGANPTKYDAKDLILLTAKYLAKLPLEAVRVDLQSIGVPDKLQATFWYTVQKNLQTRADINRWWQLCLKGTEPLIDVNDREFITIARKLLPQKPWNEKTWHVWTKALKQKTNRRGRALFMPLRKALTGMQHGPDMSKLMPLLQKINI